MNNYQKIYFAIRLFYENVWHINKVFYRYIKYKDTLFLVFSAAKTGSITAYATLLKEFPLNKILHVHHLSDQWFKKNEFEEEQKRNVFLMKRAKKYMQKYDKVKVISLIRDPFTWGVSMFFQKAKAEKKEINIGLNEIRYAIANDKNAIHASLNWCNELKDYFDFDVYSVPFDKERGYQIYKIDEKYEILIIRIDAINLKFANALKEYLGEEISGIKNENRRADDSKYSKLYKNVMASYYDNEKDFYFKYNSDYVNKFFTENQKKNMLEKFLKKYN